jgi:ATP-dependent Clp protease ATP-binding subunit ClpB
VDLQLRRVESLAADLGVKLEVTDEVKDLLGAEGYDPVFGARPLKRVIQQKVQNPLALLLLEKEVEEGSVVRVLPPEAGGATFHFEMAAP